VQALSTRTEQIALITETVKDLADQSNLLALNAAVEAVRSGDRGRGFAVIAREIRGLADQSLEATGRIQEMLRELSGAVELAAALSHRGAEQVDLGLAQIRASGETVRRLSEVVREDLSSVREIALSVGEQSAGVARIFEAVSELAAGTSQTLEGLQRSERETERVAQVSGLVAEMVQAYGAAAQSEIAKS
jgi:methyl-accepting chemotaxis protein